VYDAFTLLLSLVVFMVYAAVCGVAILFTFFLDVYKKLDEKLNMEFFSSRVWTPLEENIEWFDDWLMRHNMLVGSALIVLSLVDLKLFFDILYKV
jgi:hypothetical protein